MKTNFLFGALIAIAAVSFTATGCKDGLKSYSNNNVARPTVPDEHGRHMSDVDVIMRNEKKDYEKPSDRNREVPAASKNVQMQDTMKIENDHGATGHDQH